MSHSSLRYALVLSLLFNVGVIGAVGYQAVQRGSLPAVFGEPAPANAADHLKLSAQQRQRWHALEADFMREFAAAAKEIQAHRERLIRAMFSDPPSAAYIEAERQTISQLQSRQQQRVIEQLVKEREMLDAAQRRALADLLLERSADADIVQGLHSK
jgi:uncharacterized membrane protein